MLLVPVRVNGQDFEFLVDTGSAFTGVAASTAAYLDLPSQRSRGVRIARAHGRTVRVPTAQVGELSVGGQRVGGMTVLVLDLPNELQVDGLLGMDFLGRFRITLESDTATLVIRRPQKK